MSQLTQGDEVAATSPAQWPHRKALTRLGETHSQQPLVHDVQRTMCRRIVTMCGKQLYPPYQLLDGIVGIPSNQRTLSSGPKGLAACQMTWNSITKRVRIRVKAQWETLVLHSRPQV